MTLSEEFSVAVNAEKTLYELNKNNALGIDGDLRIARLQLSSGPGDKRYLYISSIFRAYKKAEARVSEINEANGDEFSLTIENVSEINKSNADKLAQSHEVYDPRAGFPIPREWRVQQPPGNLELIGRGVFRVKGDTNGQEYVLGPDGFYKSSQNSEGRYVYDHRNPTNRLKYEDGKVVEPRGGLKGGGNDSWESSAPLLAAESMEWEGIPAPQSIELPPIVDPKLANLEQISPNLRGIQMMAGTAAAIINRAGVYFRLGGSLAARVKGASRMPGDIDIEVQNPTDLRTVHDAIAKTDTTVTMNGESWHVQGQADQVDPGGNGGVAILKFTNQFGQTASINIDITNENNIMFNKNMLSPGERGAPSKSLIGKDGSPRIPKTKAKELVMNYLDRIYKPDRVDISKMKGDEAQVAGILRNNGISPEASAGNGSARFVLDQRQYNWINSMISEIARPGEQLGYELAIGMILTKMANGSL